MARLLCLLGLHRLGPERMEYLGGCRVYCAECGRCGHTFWTRE